MKRYVPDKYIKDFRPHNLRKTKLTMLVKEEKLDLALVQSYARHSDVKNTIRYIEYDQNEKAAVLLDKQKL